MLFRSTNILSYNSIFKVAEPDFKNGIVGKNIGDSIDTISGATVSSSAVITGIEEATAHYEDNFK